MMANVAEGTKRLNGGESRLQMFLFGMVVVLATCFVALEWNSPSAGDEDERLLEELAQDLEMLPAMEQERMLYELQLPSAPVVTPVIHVVDDAVSDAEMPDEQGDVSLFAEDEADGEDAEEPDIPQFVDSEEKPLDMRVVEQLPEFPGGMLYFIKWVTHEIRYPQAAQSRKVQGRLAVSFIVNKDGTTSDLKIVEPLDPVIDEEVLRVMRRMPDWTPGIDGGKPCRTMLVVPIKFQL
ncbi:MAG: energy transducer TonB [Prevotella sp.]|nr:energy transducer TonB [Prevotella sp.]